MPERKIELLDPRFKVHSVRGHNPMIIEAEHIGPVFNSSRYCFTGIKVNAQLYEPAGTR